MAKKSRKEIDAGREFWTRETDGDKAVFLGERRWWKWPKGKLVGFLIGFVFLGGLPLFAGYMWASESVYVFEGKQVILWAKLIGGLSLLIGVLALFGWFSFRSPRDWQARPGHLRVNGRDLASDQVKAFVYMHTKFVDFQKAEIAGDLEADPMVQIWLVLADGSKERMASFSNNNTQKGLSAAKKFAKVAGIPMMTQKEFLAR